MAYYIEEDRGYKTECYIYKGEIDRYGYGIVRKGKRKWKAHIYYYYLHSEGIPPPPEIKGHTSSTLTHDHLCRQHDCVRFEHIEQVSREENSRRQAVALKEQRAKELRAKTKAAGAAKLDASRKGLKPKKELLDFDP